MHIVYLSLFFCSVRETDIGGRQLKDLDPAIFTHNFFSWSYHTISSGPLLFPNLEPLQAVAPPGAWWPNLFWLQDLSLLCGYLCIYNFITFRHFWFYLLIAVFLYTQVHPAIILFKSWNIRLCQGSICNMCSKVLLYDSDRICFG